MVISFTFNSLSSSYLHPACLSPVQIVISSGIVRSRTWATIASTIRIWLHCFSSLSAHAYTDLWLSSVLYEVTTIEVWMLRWPWRKCSICPPQPLTRARVTHTRFIRPKLHRGDGWPDNLDHFLTAVSGGILVVLHLQLATRWRTVERRWEEQESAWTHPPAVWIWERCKINSPFYTTLDCFRTIRRKWQFRLICHTKLQSLCKKVRCFHPGTFLHKQFCYRHNVQWNRLLYSHWPFSGVDGYIFASDGQRAGKKLRDVAYTSKRMSDFQLISILHDRRRSTRNKTVFTHRNNEQD